jgi:Domain of unknown function (DUF4115)
MSGSAVEDSSRKRRPSAPRVGHGRASGDPQRRSSGSADGGEGDAFEPPDRANDDVGSTTRFITWQDLERVADEAADIDAIVRGELEAVGQQRAVGDDPFAGAVSQPHRRWRWAGGAFLAALVVVSTAFVIARDAGSPRSGATSRISPTAPATPSTTTSRSSPSPAAVVPSKAIVAHLSFSGPCWVEAVADGRRVLVGTIPDGSRTIRSKRSLLLTLGNAGGVDVLVNGRPVTTGAAGEVVHLSFALKDGKIIQLTG